LTRNKVWGHTPGGNVPVTSTSIKRVFRINAAPKGTTDVSQAILLKLLLAFFNGLSRGLVSCLSYIAWIQGCAYPLATSLLLRLNRGTLIMISYSSSLSFSIIYISIPIFIALFTVSFMVLRKIRASLITIETCCP